jgi:hypothetical protein
VTLHENGPDGKLHPRVGRKVVIQPTDPKRGDRFGRLTVVSPIIRYNGDDEVLAYVVACDCDPDEEFIVPVNYLTRARRHSCGRCQRPAPPPQDLPHSTFADLLADPDDVS